MRGAGQGRRAVTERRGRRRSGGVLDRKVCLTVKRWVNVNIFRRKVFIIFPGIVCRGTIKPLFPFTTDDFSTSRRNECEHRDEKQEGKGKGEERGREREKKHGRGIESEREEGKNHGEREKRARLKIHAPFCSRHSIVSFMWWRKKHNNLSGQEYQQQKRYTITQMSSFKR